MVVSETTKKAFNLFCEEYNEINNSNLDKKELKAHWSSLDNSAKKKYKQMVEKEEPIRENEADISDNSEYKPKKACTPYIHYLYDPEIRDPVKLANPELKSSDLTKIIASQWNELNDKDKTPWVEKSNKEKISLRENPIMVKKNRVINKTASNKIDELEIMVDKLLIQINEITTSLNKLKN